MNATTLEALPLGSIHPHPDNPRRDVGDVTELAESIRAHGIVEPLVVVPTDPTEVRGHESGFTVVMGHRRRAAAELAGLDTVPALVRTDLDSRAKQIEAMLVENLHRADLTAVEEAAAYEQLGIFGYDSTQIAAATGRSKATVERRLSLLKLSDNAQAKVHAHEMTLEAAAALVEFADDPRATAQLERVAGTNNWDWTLRSIRDTRDRVTKSKVKVAKLKKAGVRVLTKLPAYDKHLSSYALPNGGKGHSTCPGHAVHADSRTGNVQTICTKPELHPRGGPNLVSEADAEERRLRADALAAAEAVRLEKLATLLRQKKLLASAMTLVALTLVDPSITVATAADFLELVGHNEDEVDVFGDREKAAAIARAWTPIQAAHAAAAAVGVVVDSYLGTPLDADYRWARGATPAVVDAYVQLLTDLGWVPSDVDSELLAVHRPPAEEAVAS
jgi:ParB/RepB/Spo0J family partition protein